jgi:hypothetical protein
MIQDLVFAVGSLVLFLTLIPTLVNSDSVVPRTTSVPTALVLGVFSLTYFSMSFYYSAVVSLLTFLAWVGISIKRN